MSTPDLKSPNNLRIELPRDATTEEIADAALALMSEPGVAELIGAPHVAGISISDTPPILPVSPEALQFDVAALANSPASRMSAKPIAKRNLLSKALKIGGPAHMGLDLEEVRRRQKQAQGRVLPLQKDLIEQLQANFNSWDATLQLSFAAVKGGLTTDKVLELQKPLWNVVERDARRALREAYSLMWRAGREAAGNFKPYSVDETAELERMYRRQQNFYLNLLKDREQNAGRMNFERRIALYGAALKQAFWAGQVLADLSPDIYWKWELGDAEEHCTDCPKIARGGRWKCGIYSARELARLGLFPGAGQTECGTECKCPLKRVAKPQERPTGRVIGAIKELALKGLNSNPFSGAGREGREAYERNANLQQWRHRGRK